MVDGNEKKRSVCDEIAQYCEKEKVLYCRKHHLEIDLRNKQVSSKCYEGTNTYICCPHCGMGDICGTDGCYVYKYCKRCKIYVNGNCSECKEIDELEASQKRDEEQQKKFDEYFEQLAQLQEISSDKLTVKDYNEIKNLKEKVE